MLVVLVDKILADKITPYPAPFLEKDRNKGVFDTIAIENEIILQGYKLCKPTEEEIKKIEGNE